MVKPVSHSGFSADQTRWPTSRQGVQHDDANSVMSAYLSAGVTADSVDAYQSSAAWTQANNIPVAQVTSIGKNVLPAEYWGDYEGRNVKVQIIEVGENGKADGHSQQVKDTITQVAGDKLPLNVSTDILPESIKAIDSDNALVKYEVGLPKNMSSKADLDQYIDSKSTQVLTSTAYMIQKSDSNVSNLSFQFSRMNVYDQLLSELVEYPELTKPMGLSASDVKSIQKASKGSPTEIDYSTVPKEVRAKVVEYVDARLDAEGSAHQKALKAYQDVVQNATSQKSMAIVDAMGNNGDFRELFPTAKTGADANFLSQSDDLISVAASNSKVPLNSRYNPVASFSSQGSSRYMPTIAASGVELPTSQGEFTGTSAAAPVVSALVAQMKGINPNLSVDEIKQIIQGTAIDTVASSVSEGAGQLNPMAALAYTMEQTYGGGEPYYT